jgi:hypothetical protein
LRRKRGERGSRLTARAPTSFQNFEEENLPLGRQRGKGLRLGY